MLYVGQILHGYCGGMFGRDSYGDKRIEAVGVDWCVARESDRNPVFATSVGTSWDNITEMLEELTRVDSAGQGFWR